MLAAAAPAWSAVAAPAAGHGDAPAATALAGTDPEPATLVFPYNGRNQKIKIERTANDYVIIIETPQGSRTLTPKQFFNLIYDQQKHTRENFLFKIFNISSWFNFFWVVFGLLGQLVFMSRMILQWWVSEKKGESVVPVAFWWGSLIGGGMLLIYFCWRRDIVGILGQSTGALVYARNLWLIYAAPKREPLAKTG
jgi:lipid-A-disaccharide synthase-like uncharacterized protein